MPSGTTIGSAYVQILPSTEGIKEQLTKALGGEATSAGVSAGNEWGAKFVSTVKKLVVAAGIGKVITNSLNMGAEFEQNLGGTEAVFGEFAKNIQETAKSAYENMGLSASDYMATANKMGSLFQGSGLEQQRALDLTAKAMQRAADVASVMGLDTSMAMESIAGAAKGNFTMMDNLGVAMNATTLEAYALEKGVNFKWNTASNAEKAELAMQMFFDRTAQYAGNFANESQGTFSGSLGAMKAAWEDTLAAFMTGQNLDSALTNFGNTVKVFVKNNLIPAIGRMASQLPEIAAWAIDFATSVVTELKTAVSARLPELKAVLKEKLGENLYGALSVVAKVAEYVLPAIAVVKTGLTVISAVKTAISGVSLVIGLVSSPVGIAVAAIAGLIAVGVVVAKHWDEIKAKFIAGAAELKADWENLKESVTNLCNSVKEKVTELKEKISETVGNLKTAVSAKWEELKTNASETWDNIGSAASEKWNGIQETVSGVVDSMKSNLASKWDEIKATYEAHGGGMTGVAAVYIDQVRNALESGYNLINDLTGGKLDEVREKFSEKFDAAKEIVSGIIDDIRGIFHFEWSLPELRLPHIVVGEYIDVPLLGTIPNPKTLHVEWYKKAYSNPYLFTDPTVVGGLGFGDGPGGEMVYGHENLMQDIETASGKEIWGEISGMLDRINRLLTELQENGIDARAYMDGKPVSDIVTKYQRRAERAGGMA